MIKPSWIWYHNNCIKHLNPTWLAILLKLTPKFSAIICPDNLQFLFGLSLNSSLKFLDDRQHLVLASQCESPQLSVLIINKSHKILCTTMWLDIHVTYIDMNRLCLLLIWGLEWKYALFCFLAKQATQCFRLVPFTSGRMSCLARIYSLLLLV